MSKTYEIEKNRLDLAYKRYLQLLNIILISGLGAVFAYVGALILNPTHFLSYTLVILIIGIITFVFYRRIDASLREISKKIKNLGN
jgi:hypothetical protein